MGEKENNNNQNESPVIRWLRNAILSATMADQPAMMTASGWRQNEKGDYVQDQQNDPHIIQLRDNLAAEGASVMLGEFGIPAAYGLYNLGIRSLGKASNNWARAKLISREMNDIVGEGQQHFGKVKYYGPTMGKTTAAKTNPDLADFDDVTREAKNSLAKELNIPTRVLQSDPKYAQAYQEMLERELNKWRRNPLNTNKTLVISKKGLADKNIYNNEPSIPDRQTFVQRQRNRGETDDANSNDWYNMLLKQNPNLRIDNRFISEIEYNPHYIEFQSSKLPYLKKGSGIHIKKRNRGKFTEYCGGEVTDACIQKAKKSKNPTLRKRATFAQNSRRWKHEEGAKIHKPDGHRAITDNGWIPTKRLKKGTYGLIKVNNGL